MRCKACNAMIDGADWDLCNTCLGATEEVLSEMEMDDSHEDEYIIDPSPVDIEELLKTIKE